MSNEEIIKRLIGVLHTNGVVKAKQIKSWLGISARSLRYRRVDIENDFINGITDVLVEANNKGYFIVDVKDDDQVNDFMKRRKAMVFTMLKMIYRLEKAIMKRRQSHMQFSFLDMLDDFKNLYQEETKNEIYDNN